MAIKLTYQPRKKHEMEAKIGNEKPKCRASAGGVAQPAMS